MKSVFYGNYWDFNRDGESFKKLFELIDNNIEVTLDECDLTFDPNEFSDNEPPYPQSEKDLL